MSGGVASGFNQVMQGVQTGLALRNSMDQEKLRDLQEKQAKLAQYKSFSEAFDMATQNKAVGGPLLDEIMTTMGLDDEKKKMYHGLAQQEATDKRMNLSKMLRQYALDPNSMPVNELLKMKPSEQLALVKSMREMAGSAALDTAMKDVGGVGGGMGATPEMREAGGPSTSAPTLQPAGATGAPSVPSQIKGPGGQTIQLDQAQVTPVARSVVNAQRYNLAADRLEASGAPGAVEGAIKLRQQAKALEGNAYVNLTPAQTKSYGFKQGAIVQHNLINNDMKVIQPGENTFAILGEDKAKNLLGNTWRQGDVVKVESNGNISFLREGKEQMANIPEGELTKLGYKPGTVAMRNSLTNEIVVKQAGQDQFVTYSPKQAEDLGFKPGTVAQRNVQTGSMSTVQAGSDQFFPVSGSQRKVLEASGVKLDPNADYQLNLQTGQYSKIGDRGKEYEVLTNEQKKQLGLDPAFAYQRELGTKQVATVTTGQTEESARRKTRAELDKEELKSVRLAGDAAAQTQATNERIGALSTQFRTGRFADWRLFAGQVAAELTGKSDYIPGTKAGEAIEGEIANQVLGRVGQLKPVSDTDIRFVNKSIPGLLRTPEGNDLIRDISNETADRHRRIADLADNWGDKDLSEKLPEMGDKSYYQLKREIISEPLPKDLKNKITQAVDESPDPKIKGWDKPVSVLSEVEARSLSKNPDFLGKATKLQRQRLIERIQSFSGAQQ
jgi:hypothetical protein